MVITGSCNRMTSQELINFPDWCRPSRAQSFSISGIWIATCNINRGKMIQESSFNVNLEHCSVSHMMNSDNLIKLLILHTVFWSIQQASTFNDEGLKFLLFVPFSLLSWMLLF